jgi:hypothetical protein
MVKGEEMSKTLNNFDGVGDMTNFKGDKHTKLNIAAMLQQHLNIFYSDEENQGDDWQWIFEQSMANLRSVLAVEKLEYAHT